jgi:hypothetical protein
VTSSDENTALQHLSLLCHSIRFLELVGLSLVSYKEIKVIYARIVTSSDENTALQHLSLHCHSIRFLELVGLSLVSYKEIKV